MVNRKGFISMQYIFVVIIVIIALALAQNGYNNLESAQSLEKSLNWTRIGQNVSLSMQHSIDNAEQEWIKVVLSIVWKAVDFFGYAIFEVAKLAASVARDNPNIINYKVLFTLLVLSLLAPLIYPAFIITVSIFLIIKEWIQVRKEKKELHNIMKREVIK
jgi:CDP-diglyceride synthetase